MSDLDQLRDLTGRIRPPSFDALVATARRRRRRAAAAAGAAGAAVIMVIGFGALSGPDGDRSAPPPANIPTSPAVPFEFDPDEPPLPGGVRVLSQETDSFVPIEGGRYGVRLSESLFYAVDVPAHSEVFAGAFLNPGSWRTGRNGILFAHEADADTALPVHPCRDHTMRAVGPTVDDLAQALSEQPFVRVTTPVPVTVGGMDGLLVKVVLPADADLTACQAGRVPFLGDITDPAAGDDGWDHPGIVERMWILDVDGERHIVRANVATGPGPIDTDHMRAMARMVETITFTHR
jgi:hypothetical protein